MSTLGDMKTRIADELARSDLSSQIDKAITTAIAHYESERFGFNETRTTAGTVNAQRYLDLPSNFITEDHIDINVNGNDYRLIEIAYTELEDRQVNSSLTGYPFRYAKYRERLWFYPIPNGSYTVTLSYVKKLDALSSDTDSNSWTNIGEELIRARAKFDLYLNVIRNPEEADLMKALEMSAFESLKSKTSKKIGIGKLRPAFI